MLALSKMFVYFRYKTLDGGEKFQLRKSFFSFLNNCYSY